VTVSSSETAVAVGIPVATVVASAIGSDGTVGKGMVEVGSGSATVTVGRAVEVGDKVIVSEVVVVLQAARRMQRQRMPKVTLRFIALCT
jgi:hypothetical protein